MDAKLTRDEAEKNMKVSDTWIKAIESGTFNGAQSASIATLLDFIGKIHEKAKEDYESLLNPPTWAKPEEKKEAVPA